MILLTGLVTVQTVQSFMVKCDFFHKLKGTADDFRMHTLYLKLKQSLKLELF